MHRGSTSFWAISATSGRAPDETSYWNGGRGDDCAHLVAAGEGAHEAQHGEAGLSAAVDEADHLDGGNAVDHHLGQHVL